MQIDPEPHQNRQIPQMQLALAVIRTLPAIQNLKPDHGEQPAENVRPRKQMNHRNAEGKGKEEDRYRQACAADQSQSQRESKGQGNDDGSEENYSVEPKPMMNDGDLQVI